MGQRDPAVPDGLAQPVLVEESDLERILLQPNAGQGVAGNHVPVVEIVADFRIAFVRGDEVEEKPCAQPAEPGPEAHRIAGDLF